jgi:hypothetical protein
LPLVYSHGCLSLFEVCTESCLEDSVSDDGVALLPDPWQTTVVCLRYEYLPVLLTRRPTFVLLNNGVFWLRRVAVVRTDVSEELRASIIRVTRIGELRTLAVSRNRRMLASYGCVPSSSILVTLMKEALISSETSVLTRVTGVTSQKTPFFRVTAVKTSNLSNIRIGNKRITKWRIVMKVD